VLFIKGLKIKRYYENIKDRLTITIEVLFDNQILFLKNRIGTWQYVYKDGGQTINESIESFDDKYFHIFIDNIIEQLENGCDRNKLVIEYN